MSVMAMAAVPRAHGGPFTRADLLDTPDDGRRYEVIDGVLIVSAAPGPRHQKAAFMLAMLLHMAMPDGFMVLPGPVAVALAGDTEIHPDIVVGRTADFTERDIATPVLVVEVLSPSTRLFDTHVKRAWFEKAGTPSFWIVDPVARPDEAALVVWELVDGTYQQVARVVGDEVFEAVRPFPVTVIPADLVR
jgi:Uma2 family endonuclease